MAKEEGTVRVIKRQLSSLYTACIVIVSNSVKKNQREVETFSFKL